ncbi:MAG: hypothetical protein ABIW46_03900, partial [Acidimicrobiales bacterium]
SPAASPRNPSGLTVAAEVGGSTAATTEAGPAATEDDLLAGPATVAVEDDPLAGLPSDVARIVPSGPSPEKVLTAVGQATPTGTPPAAADVIGTVAQAAPVVLGPGTGTGCPGVPITGVTSGCNPAIVDGPPAIGGLPEPAVKVPETARLPEVSVENILAPLTPALGVLPLATILPGQTPL